MGKIKTNDAKIKKYTQEDMILAMRHAGNFAAKWKEFDPGRPVYSSDIDKESLIYLQSLDEQKESN